MKSRQTVRLISRYVVLMLVALAIPSIAAAKSKSDINFTFPPGKPVKIVVFRPDVQVGSLGVGGIESPDADWTAQGRKNLADALTKDQAKLSNQVVFLEDKEGADGQLVADYQSLFRAVSFAIFQHKFFGPKLPTKKDKFDWTLGPGVKKIGDLSGANYALLLYTHDSFGTGGRKAMQIVALIAFGAVVQAGIHISYASLVDLETGQVVWFNVNLGAKGDPREAAGAESRIAQVLATMPGRPAPVTKK
jgi:hypothetical protein